MSSKVAILERTSSQSMREGEAGVEGASFRSQNTNSASTEDVCSETESEHFKIRLVSLKDLRGDDDDDESEIEEEYQDDTEEVIPPEKSVSAGRKENPGSNTDRNVVNLSSGIGIAEGQNSGQVGHDKLENFETFPVGGEHKRDETKPKYFCICSKEFSSPAGLYIHIVKLTQTAKFPCRMCSKQYHFFSALKRHSSTVHKSGFWHEEQVGCSRCGKTFSNRSERRGHVNFRNERCSNKRHRNINNDTLNNSNSSAPPLAVVRSDDQSKMSTEEPATKLYVSRAEEEEGPSNYDNNNNSDSNSASVSPSTSLAETEITDSTPVTSVPTVNNIIHLKPSLLSCISITQPKRPCIEKSIPTVRAPESTSRISSTSFPSHPTPSASLFNGFTAADRWSFFTNRSAAVTCPAFQLKKTVTPVKSHFAMLQSVIREKDQLKAEFQNYKIHSLSRLKERDGTAKNWKEKAEGYRKAIIELKLQKEVLTASRFHAFQDIQEDLERLLEKVLKLENAKSPPKTNPTSLSLSECTIGHKEDTSLVSVVTRIKNLEDRIASFETQNTENLVTWKATEENLKTYMQTTSEKLGKIIECFSDFKGSTESSRFTDPNVQVNVEHMPQKFLQYTMEMETAIPDDRELERTTTETAIRPNKITLKSKTSSSTMKPVNENNSGACPSVETRQQKRMLQLRSSKSAKKKYSDRKTTTEEQNARDEFPPTLCLPSRLVKNCKRRPNSMPVLVQEKFTLRRRIDRVKESIRDREVDRCNALKIMKTNYKTSSRIKTFKAQTDICASSKLIIRKKVIQRLNKLPTNKNSSEMHIRDTSKPGYTCSCGAEFTGAGGLYVHHVKKMEIEKFGCNLCGKRFHYFSGLKAHKKSTHKIDLSEEVGCSRCGQVFGCKAERQGHLDDRGRTCWMSGSYQNKEGQNIRRRVLNSAIG